MKQFLCALALLVSSAQLIHSVDVRLLDLEPTEAQQHIDNQDTSLKYAPKVDSNVPAVRFLGNEPHNVLEDIYLANQYHGQDGLGGYLYGYAVPDIAKTERKKAGGDLRGAYNYIAGNGQEIKVEYWDDGNGFHQVDNVPKILPKQIDDTPEVKAAKEEHARLWQEQAVRNSKPIESPYNSAGQYAQGPLSVQGQQQQQQQLQYNQAQQYQAPQAKPQQFQQPQQQFQAPQGQPQQYQAPQVKPQQFQQFQAPQGQPQQYQASQQFQQPQQQFQVGQQQQKQFAGGNVQYPGDQYYSGQQTQQVNQFQKASSSSEQLKADGEDDGSYKPSKEEQEESGPPRGFFYNFDYPVGIIVSKDGGSGGVQKRSDDLQNVYATNKALFEKQLRGDQTPSGSSNGYQYVKN